MQNRKFVKNESKTPPKELDDSLFKLCRDFLAIEVPSSNIVFVEEFTKFMPLFNKELFAKTDPKNIDILARDYNSKFSLQHPIKIITREIDPNGVYHPDMRQRYKLHRTIPAMFRRVSTLNNLGKKVPALMNAFMNATSTSSGPFDNRKSEYAHAIASAISMADKKEGKIDQQRANFAKEAKVLVAGGNKPKDNKEKQDGDQEDSMTGIIDW